MRRLCGAALVAVTFAATAEPVLDIPQIGEPADTALSPAQEKSLGSEIVNQFYSFDYVLEDPQVHQYLTQLMQRIIAASDTGQPTITSFMVKDDRINAFALPGGYIGINAGTLVSARSESELASVLSHELAHVTQRHIARSIDGNQVATLATWAAVIGAIIAGSANPDVVLAAVSAGQAANYQRQVNYTRSHELEADRIAIRTLAAAGFDPEGMASFFTRLEQQSRLYGSGIPEFLRTHPVNTTRISEARSRMTSLPKQKVTESPDFSFIQARVRAFAADSPGDAAEHFGSQPLNVAANRYGLAMSYTRLGDFQRAQSVLAPAYSAQPRQIHLALLNAQILMGLEQRKEGLALYKKTLDLYPRSAPALLEYSAALIENSQPAEARQLLLSREPPENFKADWFRSLASAAREAGDLTEAQYQSANQQFERGDAGAALATLDAALRDASLSEANRAKLKARRDEIRGRLPKDWRPKRSVGNG